jgi:peptidoglycan glycosyltransferase
MGLLGASAILIAFVLFAVRGLTIASRARSDTEAFAATGLTTAISFQAFVIVGGVTTLIPLTGVTLPFMSQGGSSLLASFIIVGLLLRISDSAPQSTAELSSADAPAAAGVLGRYALGRRLTLVVTLFSVLFALLIANLSYQMIVRAPELRSLPNNNHAIAREQMAQRGAILTTDGVVLANSVQQGDGSFAREYPQGSLAAHVVGFASPRFGLAGVEASQQEALRGEMGFSSWTDAINSIAGVPVPGNDVQLTLDSRIQAEAERLLGGQSGAAVVLDAGSGAVLAMASAPSYDINAVEALMQSEGDDGSGSGSGASSDDGSGSGSGASSDDGSGSGSGASSGDGSGSDSAALFNRATAALYPPGSTFKLVTLTSALTRGGITLDDNYDAPAEIEIGGARGFVTAACGRGPL